MGLRIGQLASRTYVNKETIRYYERLGLIPIPSRTAKGYRIYKAQTVDRVNFIKKLKRLGFTLNEIDKLLGVVDRNEVKCRDIYDFTVNKIGEIQHKIEELNKLEKMLVDLKKRCPENKEIYECPIIESLM
ncbi:MULTISPECIES: Hg(II)-responsive transcriptional regulator [Bacillales]|jgi:MerR family mercuric resistance operon transcriptional regulator|uniref:Mercuric resistance operon regulatory protein n=4 Tax=Bacillales TaxID=1385 RepID=A0A6N8CSN6_9BACI|nr:MULTISPECIES: Hg(II)-responsive transcriptional regulator [Bacillales]KLI01905.1 Mercuric resistance operon regulatory protein [Sporolactobacillus inulinus CASD]MCQ2010341.1 Hg(II)-responsive transcriptional regulator [Sporolactobacillus sp. STSJ-5]MTT33061.1 Hg(II)-responsive transcriptional regulator [Terrilactibacillus tamarindi]RYL87510.1 Hg(II)-responsive transcriptional regulator [Sporolactobacillus sp. THM19-2]SFG59371.1 MerR family transcriptional regulator, mercuric resistance oper